MADPFFEGGQLPREFNRVAGNQPEPKEPDEPQLNYNPPEPVPGGFSPPSIRDVAREELDGPTRNAIEQAIDRANSGDPELGDESLTEEFNRAGWTSREIEEVQQEDQDRGLNFNGPELSVHDRHEYDQWALDSLRRDHEDKWGEKEAIEHYEEYRENAFDLDADHDVPPSGDHDFDIEH